MQASDSRRYSMIFLELSTPGTKIKVCPRPGQVVFAPLGEPIALAVLKDVFDFILGPSLPRGVPGRVRIAIFLRTMRVCGRLPARIRGTILFSFFILASSAAGFSASLDGGRNPAPADRAVGAAGRSRSLVPFQEVRWPTVEIVYDCHSMLRNSFSGP